MFASILTFINNFVDVALTSHFMKCYNIIYLFIYPPTSLLVGSTRHKKRFLRKKHKQASFAMDQLEALTSGLFQKILYPRTVLFDGAHHALMLIVHVFLVCTTSINTPRNMLYMATMIHRNDTIIECSEHALY